MPCRIVEFGASTQNITTSQIAEAKYQVLSYIQSELNRKFCPNRNDRGDYSYVLLLRIMQYSVVYSIRNYNANV